MASLEEKIRQQVKLQEKMTLTLEENLRKQLQPVKQRLAADIREVIPLGNPHQHPRRKMTKFIPEPTSRAIFTEKRLQKYQQTRKKLQAERRRRANCIRRPVEPLNASSTY
ncbi:hypothetical protein TSAR_014834 [Trichomalopsis sarcophagae]|uniref:Uncharacterized protein n=1 Tax=Trichomalopsis sarcophagae TaxID=543379 RepID=A0A232EM76_9HYME|nr:hypothetical protein TSAR_014834 [Trichomalopsis sarcophagae]